jgi:hypothetical protein
VWKLVQLAAALCCVHGRACMATATHAALLAASPCPEWGLSICCRLLLSACSAAASERCAHHITPLTPPTHPPTHQAPAAAHHRPQEKELVVHMSAVEARKIADRERKAAERAVQAKVDAMREDDNVYDVSYEGQGTSTQEVAATATDIKVGSPARCCGQALARELLC